MVGGGLRWFEVVEGGWRWLKGRRESWKGREVVDGREGSGGLKKSLRIRKNVIGIKIKTQFL